jgi:hypothetical protein
MILLLAYGSMRRIFWRTAAVVLLSWSLVSCATDMADTSSTTSKTSVPGADDSDRAGQLTPAAGVNGAGANVQF